MSEDWGRLGAYVVRRRNELGYSSQPALSEASGVSYRTISRLENGSSVGKNSLRKLERALRWRLSSMEAILDGKEPTVLPESPLSRREEAYGIILNATREELLAMANAYAEAFDEAAAEAFLLRAQEIRTGVAEERAAGQE